MSFELADLITLLDLERLEVNIYRGFSKDLGSGRVFGGQVLAQALVAARHTVEGERNAHSLHGYFILPGDLDAPIIYFVDRLRDGRSFTTRRVTAIQHGRAIFNLHVSFQVTEPGVEHQIDPPDVPPPEQLPSEPAMDLRASDRVPAPGRMAYAGTRPIDFRAVEQIDPSGTRRHPPVRHAWFRTIGRIPDDLLYHQAVLAYASDYTLLATALLPHGLSFQQPNLQMATLDHAVWYHRPARVDEWLLYEMSSPAAANARAFTRGTIYTRDGQLVASVAQEGLLRLI
ncbi:MAG TPA: acyl-CoA thioesterase II [Longimicrobiales bacterium]|nr:acyl-CoA thioesterase II [Longimicrobiales bacterium]